MGELLGSLESLRLGVERAKNKNGKSLPKLLYPSPSPEDLLDCKIQFPLGKVLAKIENWKKSSSLGTH